MNLPAPTTDEEHVIIHALQRIAPDGAAEAIRAGEPAHKFFHWGSGYGYRPGGYLAKSKGLEWHRRSNNREGLITWSEIEKFLRRTERQGELFVT